jgi:hypothetical protein
MKTEREILETVRDDMRKGEALLSRAIEGINDLVALNMDAGEARRGNAASKAAAMLMEKLGAFKNAHADGTELLFAHWPEMAGEIVVMGPGR